MSLNKGLCVVVAGEKWNRMTVVMEGKIQAWEVKTRNWRTYCMNEKMYVYNYGIFTHTHTHTHTPLKGSPF